MTTPFSSTFFESAGQIFDVNTQKLHLAMRGVDPQGRSITLGEQMTQINYASAAQQAAQAALNAYRKALDTLARAA